MVDRCQGATSPESSTSVLKFQPLGSWNAAILWAATDEVKKLNIPDRARRGLERAWRTRQPRRAGNLAHDPPFDDQQSNP
jgi:hypothetical protein